MFYNKIENFILPLVMYGTKHVVFYAKVEVLIILLVLSHLFVTFSSVDGTPKNLKITTKRRRRRRITMPRNLYSIFCSTKEIKLMMKPQCLLQRESIKQNNTFEIHVLCFFFFSGIKCMCFRVPYLFYIYSSRLVCVCVSVFISKLCIKI